MTERSQSKYNFHFITLEKAVKEAALLSSNKASKTSGICQGNQGMSKSICIFYIA